MEWAGSRDRDGYGVKTVAGKQWRAHRLAWREATGEHPGALHVLHSCDNPPCVNVLHLRLGTNEDNSRDRVERRRSRNQHTEIEQCKRGHRFTPDNTYINPTSGSRQCRTCRREDNRRRKAAKKEASA